MRNSIRITGDAEEEPKDLVERAIELVNEKINLEPCIKPPEIDRFYGIRHKTADKIRSILVTYYSWKRVHEKGVEQKYI